MRVYRMLTGTLPFSGDDLPHLLSLHLSDPVEPMTERAPSAALSKALDAVVLRALEKDPEWRQRTARDFAIELCRAHGTEDVEQGVTDGAEAISPEARPEGETSPRRRRSLQAIVVGVLVLAAALALYGVAGSGRLRAPGVAAPAPATTLSHDALVRLPITTPSANAASAVSAPWDVKVGDAVFDRPRRAAAPSRREAKMASRSTPSASVAPPDGFKIPVWKSKEGERR